MCSNGGGIIQYDGLHWASQTGLMVMTVLGHTNIVL